MKKNFLRAMNRLLSLFDAKLVRCSTEADASRFTMEAMIERLANRGVPIRCVIDIGASDGNWSIGCMKHFPEASYLAVEPLHERVDSLEKTKSRFPNFDYALCLAGESDGEKLRLQVADDLDGSTVEGRHSGESRLCTSRTIDSVVAEKNLVGPYLLKFDTHGYELPILRGSSQVLQQTAAILMETYNFRLTNDCLRFPQMCSYLEELGFRCVDFADPMLRVYDQAFWQMDLLFLREDSEVFQYHRYQ